MHADSDNDVMGDEEADEDADEDEICQGWECGKQPHKKQVTQREPLNRGSMRSTLARGDLYCCHRS